jgi:hypothetical protein
MLVTYITRFNQTMKILLILIFAFLPTVLKAQTCVSQKDEQTGEIRRSGTTVLNAEMLHAPKFSLVKTSQHNFINLLLVLPDSASNVTTNGMKLVVNYATGESKTFTTNGNTLVTVLGGSTAIVFESEISAEELNYFESNAVLLLKLYTRGEGNQPEAIAVLPQSADAIMQSVNCLTDNSPND